MMRVGHAPRFALQLALGVALQGFVVRAQSTDTVAAEALFQQGRELLLQGSVEQACPKLADSLRLDAATGTLVALAMCHEQQGKLTSAWLEFTEAEGRSRREGRADREQLSRERAAALLARQSTLRIDVSDTVAATSGLEIRRDGVAVGQGGWNVAVPIDGGPHTIEAFAPGKRPFKLELDVASEADHVSGVVLPLEDVAPTFAPAPRAAEVVSPPRQTSAVKPRDGSSRSWDALQWTSVATAVGGVALLGIGGYFLGTALDEKASSKADCPKYCNPRGIETRKDMVRHGNLATGFGISGAVLLAGGAGLFVVGGF